MTEGEDKPFKYPQGTKVVVPDRNAVAAKLILVLGRIAWVAPSETLLLPLLLATRRGLIEQQ